VTRKSNLTTLKGMCTWSTTKAEWHNDREIAATKERMDKLRAQGPIAICIGGLEDAHGALGQIPYVQGGLF